MCSYYELDCDQSASQGGLSNSLLDVSLLRPSNRPTAHVDLSRSSMTPSCWFSTLSVGVGSAVFAVDENLNIEDVSWNPVVE